MKAIDQQIFDAFYVLSDSLGYDTFVTLPNSKAKYPFVVLGDVQISPIHTMSGMLGKVYLSVDVWGTQKERLEVSTICQTLFVKANYLQLDKLSAVLDANASSIRMLRDDSTQSTLWHGLLSLEFNLRREK